MFKSEIRSNCVQVVLLLALLTLLSTASFSQNVQSPPAQNPARISDWTRFARIGAYSLADNSDSILEDASHTYVYGVEVDNDITGRYDSFLDPGVKLEQIRKLAQKAHEQHNRAFVYIAGLECITSADMKVARTLAEDHPDWIQRNIKGEPAVFRSGAAFWIKPGDEDVWISPYAPEWRKRYMALVRQIAATGIDGVFVDIPYWMTHFSKWEDTWASFDDHTVAAFHARTGLDAKKDLKLGDVADPNFRAWIDFRIQTITDFMREIDQNVKAVNPDCVTIAEIYPGIEEAAPRVGADVYQLYSAVDAVAHEYEFENGTHTSANRTPLDWLKYMVGMYSFRAFAEGKPSWILNYSWDGEAKVDPSDAMQNLFVAELMTGTNVWDARGHVMSGSNSPNTRVKTFRWIKQHEQTFYSPRMPIDPIGVYFSPATRNYHPSEFMLSYQGMLMLLLQQHREFQIVTPRTLSAFRGRTLILPDVSAVDDVERQELRNYVGAGKKLIVTGTDATQLSNLANITRIPNCPGKTYIAQLEKNFDNAKQEAATEIFDTPDRSSEIKVVASPAVVAQTAMVNGKVHVFLANFKGLRASENATQTPESGARIEIAKKLVTKAYFLPFLGTRKEIPGKQLRDKLIFELPDINKGAVVWFE